VFTRDTPQGKKPCICLVKPQSIDNGQGTGTVQFREVEFLDDGILAKVRILTDRNGKKIRPRDLRPDERVVLANQGELSDGQTISWIERTWNYNKEKNKVVVPRSGNRTD
jgi:hypothetical protein